jgi:acyl transferase domain-containing protein
MALTGSVNVILPRVTVNFCRARMMSADGRCKTFDAAADGYVRGEGCGVVILKKLSDAIADGDRVLAIVAGSATNQDGRSSGLTVPNGPAQEALLASAYKSAGISPLDVAYVEAHGTGTSLGDPIEVQSVAAVLGAGRDPQRPLILGSVKTNIGHLEAAAGISGLIKAVLALQHGEIPPHLNFSTPNPNIPWSELPVTVATTSTPWLQRRIAGVSSFGFTGTNAHVVLEAAPDREAPASAAEDRPIHLLALSARSQSALVEVARAYAAFDSSASLADVCYTANAGRTHFAHRIASSVASC